MRCLTGDVLAYTSQTMFMGVQKQDAAHTCVPCESNNSLLSPQFFFSFVWLLLHHKKGILWPQCKISAGALKSLRCRLMVILRTEIYKSQEETFIRLLLLTSTTGWEVGKSPFSNIFTSIGIILGSFFSPSNSCLGPMIEKLHVIQKRIVFFKTLHNSRNTHKFGAWLFFIKLISEYRQHSNCIKTVIFMTANISELVY